MKKFEICESFEWDYEASIAADTNIGYCSTYQNQKVECDALVCPKLEPIKQFILALAKREVIQ